jgi:transposase
MTGSFERIEVITGVARRRRWSVEEKLRIVVESLRAGASVSLVAQRHGLRSNQLFKWRKMAREGAFGPFPADPLFVPVRMIGNDAQPLLRLSSVPSRPSAELSSAIGHPLVEIELANGCRLRVGADIEPSALHRLVTTLKATG